MITGQGCYAHDPDLSALWLRARQLTFVYNQSPPDQPRIRREIPAKPLALPVEAEVVIEPPFYGYYGENIIFGGGRGVRDAGAVNVFTAVRRLIKP